VKYLSDFRIGVLQVVDPEAGGVARKRVGEVALPDGRQEVEKLPAVFFYVPKQRRYPNSTKQYQPAAGEPEIGIENDEKAGITQHQYDSEASDDLPAEPVKDHISSFFCKE